MYESTCPIYVIHGGGASTDVCSYFRFVLFLINGCPHLRQLQCTRNKMELLHGARTEQADVGRGRCPECEHYVSAWGALKGLFFLQTSSLCWGSQLMLLLRQWSCSWMLAAGPSSFQAQHHLEKVFRGRTAVLKAYVDGLACCAVFTSKDKAVCKC